VVSNGCGREADRGSKETCSMSCPCLPPPTAVIRWETDGTRRGFDGANVKGHILAQGRPNTPHGGSNCLLEIESKISGMDSLREKPTLSETLRDPLKAFSETL
jgi:hypothetical protein